MAKSSWLAGILIAGIALSGCGSEENESATTPVQGNSAPTIAGNPRVTVVAGTPYQFQIVASDSDGDTLTFTASGLPAWAQINAQTGLIQGTPAEADVGISASINVTVSDGTASVGLLPFTITVTSVLPTPPVPPTNTAPSISGSPVPEVEAGVTYAFTPEASDNETPGESLVFSVSNKPEWATFSAKTGSISGTPSDDQVADYDKITISVSDGSLTTSMSSFKISVKPRPNRAPRISGTPATSVAAGTAYVFQPSATDQDGNALSFSISNKPAWATFNSATGRLSGTPDNSHAGTTSGVVITVSDGTATTSLSSFSITVTASNRAPVISGTPTTSVVAGNAYSFTPGASDQDGDALSFSIAGKPAWANFNTSNGALSGTPSTTSAGTYAGIVITVSDSKGASASLPAFTVTVNAPANKAPVISGAPQNSVVAGSNYSFAPTASDPDGDTLSYSIAGKPTWAAFSTATGALTGVPASTAVGSYAGIVITVTDARGASVSLPAFSINVTAPAPSGTAQLSWLPPVQYTDGSQLPTADLAGYRVYHGTSPTALNDIITLDGASNTAYTMNQLVAGTHYFAVSAVTMYGAESARSEVRSKTVQ